MAKIRGPILSMSARGQIGRSQVYAGWRGVPYARQYVVPANPNTAAQQTTRNTFRSMDSQWKRLFALSQAPWDAASRGRPFVGRNLLMSRNIPVLRGQPDMLNWIGSPGNAGGLPPVAVTAAATANPGEISVDVEMDQVPTGWTVAAVVAHAFPDRDPALEPSDFVIEDENVTVTAPGVTNVLLTGATSAVLHIVAAWPRWTRPDGVTAYGPSQTTTATPA